MSPMGTNLQQPSCDDSLLKGYRKMSLTPQLLLVTNFSGRLVITAMEFLWNFGNSTNYYLNFYGIFKTPPIIIIFNVDSLLLAMRPPVKGLSLFTFRVSPNARAKRLSSQWILWLKPTLESPIHFFSQCNGSFGST